MECFFGTLTENNNGTFWLSGYSADAENGRSGLAVKFNIEGDTLKTFQYKSPYFPEFKNITSFEMQVENENKFSFVNNIFTQNLGNHSYFVVTDSLGNILHDRIFADEEKQISPSTFARIEDGYILSSTTGVPEALGVPEYTQHYIRRLDEEANIISERYYPPQPVDGEYWYGGFHILKTTDNNIISPRTTGYYLNEDWIAGRIGFIKFNYDLDILWMTEFDRPNGAYNLRITEALDSTGYVAVGSSFANGNYHGHIAKVSPDGDSLWYRIYNYIDWEDHRHEFWDVEPTADGGYIMCGYNTTQDFIPDEPRQQAWIVKTDEYGCLVPDCHLVEPEDTVGMSNINLLPKINLKLYPNPASDILNIFFKNPNGIAKGVFRILDEQGRVVQAFESNLAEVTHVLSVSDYVGGVYFLQYLEEGAALVSRQFVIF